MKEVPHKHDSFPEHHWNYFELNYLDPQLNKLQYLDTQLNKILAVEGIVQLQKSSSGSSEFLLGFFMHVLGIWLMRALLA